MADEQRAIAEALEKIHHSAGLRALDPSFDQTSWTLSDAQSLLDQPRTDKFTDAAQVNVVENLTDIINLLNELAQKSSPQQGDQASQSGDSAEQMAFLTKLMSQGAQPGAPGMTPGGNTSGGNTSRTGSSVTGDVTGASAGARNVSKAAGAAIESYPAEFRDALRKLFPRRRKASPVSRLEESAKGFLCPPPLSPRFAGREPERGGMQFCPHTQVNPCAKTRGP